MNDRTPDTQQDVDAEEALSLLQDLYDKLPAMQKRGEALARARQAQTIVRLEGELRTARVLLDEAEARERAAREAFAQAQRGGDDALVDERRRAALHAGALKGFRVGPAKNAEAALAQALEEGSFADASEARAALMDDEALSTLEEEVEAYRRAYAQALERCQQLAGADDVDGFDAR
ncbi:hypothetical protein [Gordonibacter massiliensis (ex Traore et al. 2017)]|uniref:hypothetical protein n=1 Tax=Gordonibacter massiliensis (ex Traore et al. 2017) TaxID=1841863 RepID=UPI001C8BAA33|nr:hypothetical protein [Gordonibacter massiliensis (ex Traore et al. 2017)]MBX9035169.1 hypothetical protein [Gordonibacter massiliensis (ex Traore et al. 2017)]